MTPVLIKGCKPAYFNLSEHQRFVERLERAGTSSIKGAVEQVAGFMGVSRRTLYTDLKKAREAKGGGAHNRPAGSRAAIPKEET